MADMTAAAGEQLNSRLKKDYAAKANNLRSYYNQLYGKNNSAASVGSSSAASGNTYSDYLAKQNSVISNSSAVKQSSATGGIGKTNGALGAKVKSKFAANNGTRNQGAQSIGSVGNLGNIGNQQAANGTSANNNTYLALSRYDQGLSQEAQAGILAEKRNHQNAQARGDTGGMRDAHVAAQLYRAINGGYIDDIGDGTGYKPFGFSTLMPADRENLSEDEQKEILRCQLYYMYSDSPEEKEYWNSKANDIRRPHGYTSPDGKTYVKNDILATPYSGYPGGEFTDGAIGNYGEDGYVDTYTARMNALNDYIANRQYDPETDPAYQAYKAQYERNASAAANSALAQAAGNTGGIANSYAMALSNAAQQSYMKQLTDVIPTLQQQDYADKLSLLNALGQQQSSAYSRYAGDRDFDYNVYMQNVQNALDLAKFNFDKEETAASRDWQTQQNKLAFERDKEFLDYQRALGLI